MTRFSKYYVVRALAMATATTAETSLLMYSSFKQNIKSCNAKRRRQLWRTVKNNNRSN